MTIVSVNTFHCHCWQHEFLGTFCFSIVRTTQTVQWQNSISTVTHNENCLSAFCCYTSLLCWLPMKAQWRQYQYCPDAWCWVDRSVLSTWRIYSNGAIVSGLILDILLPSQPQGWFRGETEVMKSRVQFLMTVYVTCYFMLKMFFWEKMLNELKRQPDAFCSAFKGYRLATCCKKKKNTHRY